jgi:hypothetical protein
LRENKNQAKHKYKFNRNKIIKNRYKWLQDEFLGESCASCEMYLDPSSNKTNILRIYWFPNFSLILLRWMSAYIRKTDGVYIYVFSLPEKKWPTKNIEMFTLHWINSIIRYITNNKQMLYCQSRCPQWAV